MMEIDEITSHTASPKVLSENEIQRLELKRLLGTAKTTERVEHIKQALESLDNNDSDVKIKPNQHIAAIHPNHSHLFNSPKDIDNPVSQVSKLRPMSAQNRRPSLPFNSNLGVIPENKTLTHRNIDNNVETDITIEDIDDICSSSHDPRYPPINILKGVNSMDDIGWIPTGLVPQILFINFHLRWLVRKIEITCTGVEEISINIMSGARIASNIYKFKKMADDKFLFESISLSDGAHTDQNSNDSGTGIIGKKIFVIFSKANTQFFKVTDMKIRAMPCS